MLKTIIITVIVALIVGLGLNTIRSGVEAAMMDFYHQGEKFTEEFDGVKVQYAVNDDCFGRMLAGIAFNGVIIISSSMYESSHRRACLAHEYSHIIHNDRPTLVGNISRLIGIEPEYEKRADSLAVEMTSREEVLSLISAVR